MTPEPLTEREAQVLGYMAEGLSNPDIGRELWLAVTTIKDHARSLYKRLGVHDRAHAVSVGYRTGLLSLPDAVVRENEAASAARALAWNTPDRHLAACFAAASCPCQTFGSTDHSRACLVAPACPCRIRERAPA